MKIVIATSRPFHLGQLARELSQIGHEVTVYGYMPSWKIKNYNLGNSKYISFFWLLLPLSIFALQRKSISLQSSATYKLMPFMDRLVSSFSQKCDVFIGLSGVYSKSFIDLKAKYNCKTVCDRGSAHVLTQNKLVFADVLSKTIKKYTERELNGYKKADYITVPSIFSRKSFLENGVEKDKLFINNYGVDLERFQSARNTKDENSDKLKAVFVGGFNYQKGADIMSKMIINRDDINLDHIGSPGDLAFPKKENFKSIGHIPNKELGKALVNYDILLLPSRQDGFGMVILEALASGLHIITSENTGGPDVKKNLEDSQNIILMEDISEESLHKAIDFYKLNLHSKKVNLSQKDKNYFSWKSYASRYNEFLNKIVTT